MDDPFFSHDDRPLMADRRVARLLLRVQWLKIATGLLALSLLGAIWAVWRWPQ
jgi:hypothetical protein